MAEENWKTMPNGVHVLIDKNGEIDFGSNNNDDNDNDKKIKELKSKLKKANISLSDLGYRDSFSNADHKFLKDKALRELDQLGLSEEDKKTIIQYAESKRKEKTNSFKEFAKNQKENYITKQFGDDVKITGDIVKWKHFVNDNEIRIATNNVQYWPNKNQFVMWVDNDKIVYLKPWQVQPIKQWKNGEGINGYMVKLNKEYFKPYNSFRNENMRFDKADTFESLVEVAKEQDKENEGWKLGNY